jgi:transposase-like protein
MVEMMSEGGIVLTHTTILRWVERHMPELERRWLLYALPAGGSWR